MANFETKQANLVFNTKSSKKHIISNLSTNDESSVKIKGAHIALAAALEQFVVLFSERLKKYTVKDKSGLRTVTKDIIKKTLRHFDNNDFGEFFNQSVVYKFDRDFKYYNSFFINLKSYKLVVESVYDDMKFTEPADNFFFFMLTKVTNKLIRFSNLFIQYAKKKTLDSRSFMHAINVIFEGELAFKLNQAVEKAVTLVKSSNYKSTLQQYFTKEKLGTPDYVVVNEETNKDGIKNYKVNVLKNKKVIGEAEWNSKGRAEQHAARNALLKLGIINEEDEIDNSKESEDESNDSDSSEDESEEEEEPVKKLGKSTKKISDDEDSEDSDDEDSEDDEEDEKEDEKEKKSLKVQVKEKKTSVKPAVKKNLKTTKKKPVQKKKVRGKKKVATKN